MRKKETTWGVREKEEERKTERKRELYLRMYLLAFKHAHECSKFPLRSGLDCGCSKNGFLLSSLDIKSRVGARFGHCS